VQNNNQALEYLLREIVRNDGTDLLLAEGSVPLLRIDGALRPMGTDVVIDEPLMASLIGSLLDEEQRAQLVRDRDIDFAFSHEDASLSRCA
jgi:twitching motility protein PilT